MVFVYKSVTTINSQILIYSLYYWPMAMPMAMPKAKPANLY